MVKKRRKRSVGHVLINILAIISIIGFIIILSKSLFGLDLGRYMVPSMLIVFGVGLTLIGQIKAWRTFFRDGLTMNEGAHIITGILGIVAVIVGIVSIRVLDSAIVDAIQGVIAIIAIAFIIIQTWLISE